MVVRHLGKCPNPTAAGSVASWADERTTSSGERPCARRPGCTRCSTASAAGGSAGTSPAGSRWSGSRPSAASPASGAAPPCWPSTRTAIRRKPWLVTGSNAGQAAMPGWVFNVRAHDEGTLEIEGTSDAGAVRGGDGRGARRGCTTSWRQTWSAYRQYEQNAGREIPVFRVIPAPPLSGVVGPVRPGEPGPTTPAHVEREGVGRPARRTRPTRPCRPGRALACQPRSAAIRSVAANVAGGSPARRADHLGVDVAAQTSR